MEYILDMPNVGEKYYRIRHAKAQVIQIESVDDGVIAKVLYGSRQFMRKGHYKCKQFQSKWKLLEEDCDDYSKLDGCIISPTFLVLRSNGEPLFRCGSKRAKFYLKKGYATQLDEGTLQLSNDVTEKVMDKLYDKNFNSFFMAVKNDKCVCCGRPDRLTRHHVVPQRHKDKLPLYWRRCLSNILFVCIDCHERYEKTPEPNFPQDNWRDFLYCWKSHFIETMKPEYLPDGWDILTVQDMDFAESRT